MRNYTKIYIDGAWAVSTGGEVIDVINPATEFGNSACMRQFVKREVMPGNLKGAALEDFARDAASAFWHQACTAKMGCDELSVVNGRLQVYGIDNLRIADASIMPRITTGNTMAVINGERAAQLIRATYGI
jgi:choline dehydrogenase